MFCKNCGAEMKDKQAVCLNCGFKAGDGKKFCAHCGKEVAEGAAVCVNCGYSIESGPVINANTTTSYLNGNSKITMALVCLFLGEFGVHNFIMGESKKGIFRIILTFCTGIGGGILALIDLIKILSGSYVVDPNKLI